MRTLDQVIKFLEDKGFTTKWVRPGQSYRCGGALFFWKDNPAIEKQDRLPKYIRDAEIRGRCRDGRRVFDIVRLFPVEGDEPSEDVYILYEIPYQDPGEGEVVYSKTGLDFKRPVGVVYSKPKRDFSDLLVGEEEEV